MTWLAVIVWLGQVAVCAFLWLAYLIERRRRRLLEATLRSSRLQAWWTRPDEKGRSQLSRYYSSEEPTPTAPSDVF